MERENKRLGAQRAEMRAPRRRRAREPCPSPPPGTGSAPEASRAPSFVRLSGRHLAEPANNEAGCCERGRGRHEGGAPLKASREPPEGVGAVPPAATARDSPALPRGLLAGGSRRRLQTKEPEPRALLAKPQPSPSAPARTFLPPRGSAPSRAAPSRLRAGGREGKGGIRGRWGGSGGSSAAPGRAEGEGERGEVPRKGAPPTCHRVHPLRGA